MPEVSLKQVSPIATELSFIVGRGEVDAEYDRFCNEIKNNVVVEGFRKGHAPVNVIRQKFADQIKAEVSTRIIHRMTEDAIREKAVKAVGNPTLKEDYRTTKTKKW